MAKEGNETGSVVQLGRRQRKALAVRRALFDAGLEAFERQPIGLVSVLDITETADVAKGVFYLQFRSKDDYLLELWEDVQSRFLAAARMSALDCPSSLARTEAVVRALFEFTQRSPAAARFWLRMAGFFSDEIGEPGQLSRIRQEYLQQLAGAISGRNIKKLTRRDIAIARMVDMFGWSAVASELHQGKAIIDPQRLAKAIWAALGPAPRS